jgi:hypothetical protein
MTFFAFGSAAAVPSHTWTGIAYYGGFGAVLLVLAWMGPRLRRIDPGSLRARLALTLAAAAAVPLLVLVPLYANEEESWTVSEVLASQQLLTSALAQDVANYIDLHRAAVKLLAGQPALLALSPAEQHAVLKNARAAFPDVVGFSTAPPSSRKAAVPSSQLWMSWSHQSSIARFSCLVYLFSTQRGASLAWCHLRWSPRASPTS